MAMAYLATLDVPTLAANFDWLGAHSVYLWKVEMSTLDLCTGLVNCTAYRAAQPKDRKIPILESFVSCIFLQFAGTSLTALMLGQPPSWITGDRTGPALVLAWWLVVCAYDALPGFARAAVDFVVRGVPMRLVCSLSKAHSITSWGGDKALAADNPAGRNSLTAMVLASCFSTVGGGLFCNWLGLGTQSNPWAARAPARLAHPDFTLQRAFVLAVAYYALRDAHGRLFGAPPLDASLARLVVAAGMFGSEALCVLGVPLERWTAAAFGLCAGAVTLGGRRGGAERRAQPKKGKNSKKKD